MSRNELCQNSLVNSLTPAEKAKFIEILSGIESQKVELKDLHSNLLIGGSRKASHENLITDDYWDCKWTISHSIISGRKLSRWGCAAASIDNNLYLFGGRGSDSRTRNSFHILDLKTNQFSLFKTINTPKGREGHSMSAYKNLLIIYGGCEGGGNENEPFEDIWIVDIENKTWKKPNTIGKKPEAREGHAAGVIKNFMIIYGGSGVKSLLSNIHAFNLTNFEWKELDQVGVSMGARESMSSAIVNDIMYIFGGNISDHSSENDEYTDDFFSISLKNYTAYCKKITTDGPIPPKRLSHSLSNLNNKYLVLFGGESCGKALNDIWVYSIEKNIWQEIKPQNQISARMAHVCYCYKDNVLVYGGMTKDQTVKNDLAVLKFGRCEINMSNGSGVNPKRKITKILNVTARTAPVIHHQDREMLISICQQCGHSSTSCKFLTRFPLISYPVVNFYPRIQISAYAVDQMACQFQDPFAAMLRIVEVMNSLNAMFNVIGTANIRAGQFVKALHLDGVKDMMHGRGNDLDSEGHVGRVQNNVKSTGIVQVPILEISSKVELLPDQIAHLCSSVSAHSFLPAFFKLSDTAVIISRSKNFLTIALVHRSDLYIPLFFGVFDNSNNPIYPSKELIYPNIVNVYSNSHLQSGDVFKHPYGTSIFLYPKDLEVITGDILYQGNSFSHLVSKLKGVQYIVAGSLIKRDKHDKEKVANKPFFYKTSTNIFSVLVYVKKKLVYWEFKKNDKGKRAREDCIVVKLDEEDYVSQVTGQLIWNLQTLNLFSDLYSPTKKRLTE
ncbi:hypothetical protein SteCoe_22616 [Stentor coeruleus]|uniref:Uncharacterized protein n=1 Tax=Stentor coeruleus TaxID=5963 RepID=A0A1R2BLK4_9CILI|nr:hypothetical protein SteCoe_22616 [Stentor coeruleus]